MEYETDTDEDKLFDVCYPDTFELTQNALDYFQAEKRKNKRLVLTISRLKASLYGEPGGRWSDRYIDYVREWLLTTTYDYWEWTATDANGELVEGPTAHVYASKYKAAIVGRELAQYV